MQITRTQTPLHFGLTTFTASKAAYGKFFSQIYKLAKKDVIFKIEGDHVELSCNSGLDAERAASELILGFSK